MSPNQRNNRLTVVMSNGEERIYNNIKYYDVAGDSLTICLKDRADDWMGWPLRIATDKVEIGKGYIKEYHYKEL